MGLLCFLGAFFLLLFNVHNLLGEVIDHRLHPLDLILLFFEIQLQAESQLFFIENLIFLFGENFIELGLPLLLLIQKTLVLDDPLIEFLELNLLVVVVGLQLFLFCLQLVYLICLLIDHFLHDLVPFLLLLDLLLDQGNLILDLGLLLLQSLNLLLKISIKSLHMFDLLLDILDRLSESKAVLLQSILLFVQFKILLPKK